MFETTWRSGKKLRYTKIGKARQGQARTGTAALQQRPQAQCLRSLAKTSRHADAAAVLQRAAHSLGLPGPLSDQSEME